MTDYVFDTEPLVAYFYDEPGADEVRERLAAVESGEATGVLSHATAAEVAYKVARLETGDPTRIQPDEGHLERGRRDVRVLEGFGCTIETPAWRLVAEIKAPGRISLGDAYAVALAVEESALLVVGADADFEDLSVAVELDRIREGPY